MIAQLPALQVVIPLLAAPLCVLVRAPFAAWLSYAFAALASLACAILLLIQVSGGASISYAMGGWAPPAGIEYRIDAANAIVLLLVSVIAVAVAVYGRRSIAAEIEDRRAHLYYACLCLCLAGLLGIAATGDAFNVFVFLEISSLASYALIALGRRPAALLAAFQYLILGSIGATFLLIGIGLLYALTGTLNMADLAARLPALYGNNALAAALGFVAIGLAIKVGLFPLHAWVPGAYAEAPSAASVFLSATSSKVAIYALARFLFGIFGASYVFTHLGLGDLGLLLGSLAMLAGAAVACFQTDLKRLLAYSSIGQVGYIIVGISLGTREGVAAGFLHLFNHGLIKAGLFAVAGMLLLRLGSTRIADLAGLARRMPWTFAAFLIGGLGLVGVPVTAGFVSKWALLQALIEAEQWWVLAALLGSSLLALVYIGRVVEVAWYREPAHGAAAVPPPPLTMVFTTWALIALSLYLGLNSEAAGELAAQAAADLLGSGR